MLEQPIAAICLVWYIFIIIVNAIGIYKIRRSYTSYQLPPASTTTFASSAPHITIIRPVKGLEPSLYDCLAATFLQSYQPTKLTIYFCVSSRSDPALPTLQRLLTDFPAFDAHILVEEEDPNLRGQDGGATTNLGPNPKIRNMSRAWREAKGDFVWIIDCNVWVGPDAAGRMVDALCGFNAKAPARGARKYKFVHQLPLVVDVTDTPSGTSPDSPSSKNETLQKPNRWGGLLEELFLSTSHAKFYTAINTVAIAPCIIGKSNMFRRSHLNSLTSPSSPISTSSTTASVPLAQQQQPGIDYFSSNICEDHLIGDLLWKNPVPGPTTTNPNTNTRSWGNHALLPPHASNLAIQPLSHLPLSWYLSRRTRWLRVRKFTVTLATLVEPGTESLLCSAYGAYALGYYLGAGGWGVVGVAPQTTRWGLMGVVDHPQTTRWAAMAVIWVASVVMWMGVDRWVYGMLQSCSPVRGQSAPFMRSRERKRRRPLREWVMAWLGREALALPIWAWAFWGGVSVVWRGRRFRVGMDMRVREIEDEGKKVM